MIGYDGVGSEIVELIFYFFFSIFFELLNKTFMRIGYMHHLIIWVRDGITV